MKGLCLRWHYLMPGLLLCLLSGCATTNGDNPIEAATALPLIPGEATLQMSKTNISEIRLPASARMSNGSILMFSPIEFRSEKNGFNVEAAALPLGRYVATRYSGEGITADLSGNEARSFNVHYDARYPDLQSARRDFPTRPPAQYRHVAIAGKDSIEIEQWRLRLTMMFSKDHQAFRVLLDDLDYTAPAPQVVGAEEPQPQAEMRTLPVIVAFSYRHPDSTRETLIQQNIFFEFKVSNQDGGYHGSSQISGWVPLHADAQSLPYTVGIVVAEVHVNREDFYKKLFEVLKNVRGLI
jgi:hypothetical protein